jgi:predicted DNA-binding transcriptional regulator AlpA
VWVESEIDEWAKAVADARLLDFVK